MIVFGAFIVASIVVVVVAVVSFGLGGLYLMSYVMCVFLLIVIVDWFAHQSVYLLGDFK